MAAADFNNDKKDAGDVGAGHSVTALYEVLPAGEARLPEWVGCRLRDDEQQRPVPARYA